MRQDPASSVLQERPRVLVVDDDPLLRRCVCRLLESAFITLGAEDGETALALVRRGVRVDAVVSDVMMGGMDGTELHRQLVASGNPLARAFLFLSGGMSETQRAYTRASAVRVLLKPVARAELVGAIARLCRARVL